MRENAAFVQNSPASEWSSRFPAASAADAAQEPPAQRAASIELPEPGEPTISR